MVVVATNAATEPSGQLPDAATVLSRLAIHAGWTRAVQLVSIGQKRECSVWNVAASAGGTNVGHEIVRDALSAFAALASAQGVTNVRVYSVSLVDQLQRSVDALASAGLLVHFHDAEGLLSGNQLLISGGGIGCLSRPDVVATATAGSDWMEDDLLRVMPQILC
jgi:predicted glycosyltransferase